MNFQSLARRTACGVGRIFLLGAPVAVLCAVLLSGCVRVAGTAGYWHTGEEGEAQVKQAGFDTANLVQKGKGQGNIAF